MIELEYNIDLPSSNTLYYTDFRTRTRHLNKRGKALSKQIVFETKRQIILEMVRRLKDHELSVEINIYKTNWYCKNGNVRKIDLSNYEKFITDQIFKTVGIDDSYIFKLEMNKYYGNNIVIYKITRR